MIKDGFHTLNGYRVYVENGRVMYGIFRTSNGEQISHPYRWNQKLNCYVQECGMTVAAFRSATKRMSVEML